MALKNASVFLISFFPLNLIFYYTFKIKTEAKEIREKHTGLNWVKDNLFKFCCLGSKEQELIP